MAIYDNLKQRKQRKKRLEISQREMKLLLEVADLMFDEIESPRRHWTTSRQTRERLLFWATQIYTEAKRSKEGLKPRSSFREKH